jgi:uncharacterized protein (TIRG00374 family)
MEGVTHKIKNAASRNKNLISRGSIFFYIFSLVLFAGVAYYFSEIEKEVKLLEKINAWWLLAATGAQLLTYLFTAIVYKLLLSGLSIHNIRLRILYKVSVISFFFNQVVPSAGVSGNTFLFNFFVKRKLQPFRIISVILSELVIFYAAMEAYVLFCLLCTWFFYKTPASFTGVFLAGLVVYILFAGGIMLAAGRKSAGHLYTRLKKIKLIKKYFEKFDTELAQAKQDGRDKVRISSPAKKIILKTWIGQLLIIAFDVFTIFCLFQGFGVTVSFVVVILALTGTKIISIIPFTPGALVLYESGLVFFLTSLAVPFGSALMVTLVYRFLSFWLPIPVGLILYRRWQKNNRR